jgi:hypothetical protein
MLFLLLLTKIKNMKKVFQTIIDKGNGNCMQSVVASLFDLELSDVPHFLEHDNPNGLLTQFFLDRSYGSCFFENRESTEFLWHMSHRPPIDELNKHVEESIAKNEAMRTNQPTFKEVAKYDGGVNGYFYAVVKSQTFEDTTHAVICDLDLNIIHDPNPNGNALKLKECDILRIMLTKDFYIDFDGKFIAY